MKLRYGNSVGRPLGNFSRENLDAAAAANHALSQIKKSLLEEYGSKSGGRLLHLALNEAEALAWQTDFPFLVFPLLAAEKAQTTLSWNKRQSAINPDSAVAFAA